MAATSAETNQLNSSPAPSRERNPITVCQMASGFTLTVPVLVLKGSRPGPRVGIAAAIHGDEIVGTQVIRDLWESVNPDELSGSLSFMPVANPLAFEALSRNTPIDTLDANRNFPGVADGWLSEQLAAAITEKYLRHLDYFIDVHAGGTFPVVDYCYLLNDADLSRAFLSELLYKPAELYPGTSAGVAVKANIPTTVIELGGGNEGQADQVARGVRGVRNMLRYTGSLSGQVEKKERQLLLHNMKVMRPRAGGLCYPVRPLPPGTFLDGKAKLATIVSPYTFEILETVFAPFNKNVVVLSRNYTTRINPGDYMFMIGDSDTAEYL
jgi:uncharacterized protein